MSLYFSRKNKKYLVLFFVFLATLFLTFSRGAIYAAVVGLVCYDLLVWIKAPKSDKKAVLKNIVKTVGVFVLSFLFTLNLQGVLAAASPTSDNYSDGVAKVINHLSLGVIDIRSGKDEGTDAPVENSDNVTPVTAVENSDENAAVFDGYVAESTDTRVRLTRSALEIWRKDFKTVMVGVGIGGAGQALYDNGLSPAPKEIVQNEYASLLLETGLTGVSLFVVIIVLAVKVILKNRKLSVVMLSLLVAYGVTILFFSGLPNALQVVLMVGLLVVA